MSYANPEVDDAKPERRMWQLWGALAPLTPGNETKYKKTIGLRVIAPSAAVALQRALRKHPGLSVYSLQHHGLLDIDGTEVEST